MKDKPCFIEVTELRAIKSDASQWMLMKRTKATDKATKQPTGGYSEWYSYKYHSQFEQAVASLEKELVRMSGASTFHELQRNAEKIHQLILDTLERAKVDGKLAAG